MCARRSHTALYTKKKHKTVALRPSYSTCSLHPALLLCHLFGLKVKKRIKSPDRPDFLCERAMLFCYLKRTPRILARIAREHRLRCCRALRVRFCFYIQDSTILLLCQESATSFYGIPTVPLDRSRRARYTVGKKGGLLPCHLHS